MEKRNRSHWPISILSNTSAAVNMLLPLLLVRILSPEEVGTFKIFFLYLMILPALALTTGVVSGLAYWAGRKRAGKSAIQTSSLMIVVAGTLFFIVSFLLSKQICALFGWPAHLGLPFSLSLFAAITSVFFEEAAISTGRIWRGAIFYSGFEIIRSVSMLAVAYYTRSLESIFWTHVGVTLFKAVVGYAWGIRLGLVGFHWNPQVFRSVWGYAFPVSLAWVFGTFVNYSDQFILSTQLDAAAFAVYSIGCLMIPPLFILEQSITRILIPQLSECFAEDQTSRAAHLLRKAVDQLALLLVPAVALLVIFAEPVINLLFTSTYANSAPYLQGFAFTYLFLIFPYDSVPRSRGEGRWILGNFIVFSSLSLALCASLVYFFGAWGALGGILIARSAMRSYGMIYVRKSTQWNYGDFLPLSSFFRYPLIAALFGGISTLYRPHFNSDLEWMLWCAPIVTIIYFVFAISWKNRDNRKVGPRAKILMLTHSLKMGGLERMVLNLCRGIQKETEHPVSVYAYDHNKNDDQDLVEMFRSIDVDVSLTKKSRGFSPTLVFRLIRHVFDHQIQIIHSHDIGSLIYASLVKIFSLNRVRVVHTQHSSIHLDENRRNKWYILLFSGIIEDFTTVSESTRNSHVQIGMKQGQIKVVENGVAFAAPEETKTKTVGQDKVRKGLISEADSPLLREHLEQNRNSFWLLYMSRLHPVKGQMHALEVWKMLRPQVRSRSMLFLIGPEADPGYAKKLRNKILELPHSERVILMDEGTLKTEQWLKASNCYLSCSELEGMPLGPVEAIGAGLPALLSDIPGHQFLKQSAGLFPLDQPAEGARKVEKVFVQTQKNKAQLNRKLWNHAQWIRESYSIRAMTRRYAELYDKVS